MAIQKLAVENFTVFDKMEIEFCDGVNVFIGENGTGKTHLLKVLYLCLLECRIPANVDTQMMDLYLNEIKKTDELSRLFGINSEFNNGILFRCVRSNAPDDFKNSFATDELKDMHKIFIEHSTLQEEPIFIPAKEVLSMAKIATLSDKDLIALDVDKTLTDIIIKAQNYPLATPLTNLMDKTLPKLANIIDGSIFVDENKSFWIRKTNGTVIPLTMEAEGFKKLGLLGQLILNKNIDEGTTLLWDEPEANINPKLIPDLVETILELSRNGVQVFIATHDYFLPKYFEVLSKKFDSLSFHSLYKTNDNGVKCETSDKFSTLTNNDIINEKILLYEAEIEKVMK